MTIADLRLSFVIFPVRCNIPEVLNWLKVLPIHVKSLETWILVIRYTGSWHFQDFAELYSVRILDLPTGFGLGEGGDLRHKCVFGVLNRHFCQTRIMRCISWCHSSFIDSISLSAYAKAVNLIQFFVTMKNQKSKTKPKKINKNMSLFARVKLVLKPPVIKLK